MSSSYFSLFFFSRSEYRGECLPLLVILGKYEFRNAARTKLCFAERVSEIHECVKRTTLAYYPGYSDSKQRVIALG